MSSTTVRGLCEHGLGGHAQADRKAIEEKQLLKVALCRLGMWVLVKVMVIDPTLDMELGCQPSLLCYYLC